MDSTSTSRPFPGFAALYTLTEPGVDRYFRARLELGQDGRQVTRGEVIPDQPVHARWVMGGQKPVDLVWTDSAIPLLVSDSVSQLLRENTFTGWSLYDVSLHTKTGEEVPSYAGLVVNGRCGPIDNSKSIQVPKQFPAKLSMIWKGLYFDPASWDGSDLFMADGGWGYIFVTRAVKEAFERARIRNVVFTPLDEVERTMLF